jgi:Tfp pilus assembly protein PilP
VNRSASVRTIPEPLRGEISAVRDFAGNEAQYALSNILTMPENASLSETGTSRTGNLWLSSYSVSYEGIPLRERFLRMNIGAVTGEVMLIRNSIPAKQPNSLAATISRDEIVRQSTTLLGIHSVIKSAPRLVFVDETQNNSLRLCYELTASEPDMNEMWRLTFDAITGILIEKKSLLEHEDLSSEQGTDSGISDSKTDGLKSVPIGSIPYHADLLSGAVSGKVLAKVHLHTPFDTLTTVGLPYAHLLVNGASIETDSNGSWTLPFANYPLTIQTSFDSRFFTVLRQDQLSNSTLQATIPSGISNVLWDDSNSDPAERDAYYSASYAHLADKRLDEKLTNIDLHMKVNVNINSACNAYYIPNDTSINFFLSGSGCSNTGQIADVVFHEYGHRVTNARYQQAAGTDWNIVDGSLGEGFADLNSAFIRDDPRIGVGFFGNNTKIIRTCDNARIWPRDISTDIHISGEIISGAFWDLRKTVGREIAQHLFHFMEYQMPDGNGSTDSASLEDAFSSVLIATIVTDDNDNDLSNGTPHLKEILAAFRLHNIKLVSFIPMTLSQVKDQDTSASSYNTVLKASYQGIIGSVNEKNVMLHYSMDEGKTYSLIPMKSINGQYEAAIPKMPAGMIVRYYASLTSPLDETDTMNTPSPGEPYSFTIGYRLVIKDDAEQNTGWSLNAPNDKATTGFWVREKPHGTFNDPTPPIQYIQQDTDHTEKGTMCYVTGNLIDPSGNNLPGYDDVDGGAVTLTTPAFDLSQLKSPYIRYWYYYSNDQGNNPGVAKWQVDISNDNGASWKSLQLTDQSTNGWTEFSFPMTDYLSPSASVKIRFIASDFILALIEAGVDDLEILDPIQTGSELVKTNVTSGRLPYPNPIRRGDRLHLSFDEDSPRTLYLTDLLGRIFTISDINEGSLIIPQNFPPGIYFTRQTGQRLKIIVEP